MTPKEKAKQLVDQFEHSTYSQVQGELAKECALIAVDEILEGYEFDSLYIQDKRVMDNINFWDEVKQEIEKL